MAKKSGKVQQQEEALRLKTLAVQKYNSSSFKSALKYAKKAQRLCSSLAGIAEMVTAFTILCVAANSKLPCPTPSPQSQNISSEPQRDWYKILDLEPFCHINSIKKQYKKLALVLHPDKNTLEASEEAFKLVNDAFQVLSDKIKRKDYDMKLRIAMQAAAADEIDPAEEENTFWTACPQCKLFHQYERKYIGHNLVCPNCKTSFKAFEVPDDGVDRGEEEKSDGEEGVNVKSSSIQVKSSEEIGQKSRESELRRKMSSVAEVLRRSEPKKAEVPRALVLGLKSCNSSSKTVNDEARMGSSRLKASDKKRKMIQAADEHEESRHKKAKNDEDMTLAEIQFEAKRKMQKINKLKANQEIVESERTTLSKSGDMEIMAVVDSDFYEFDNDRVERSFKKGQVWAIYDDDDGMPRHYGLILEVVSVNPFVVNMCWFDVQTKGDENLVSWERKGFHISCGRFMAGRKATINLVNIFSHLVECERAAKEIYRIYPKKGSVWALYSEKFLDTEEMSISANDRRSYDIVVFLTSFSEVHGLSMAYLEKVDGFRTVFKRREIGCDAIKWLEKADDRLFSHQIPARKLTGDEIPDHLKDCWELDPAALPPELLTIESPN